MSRKNGFNVWMTILTSMVLGLIGGFVAEIHSDKKIIKTLNERLAEVEIELKANSKQIPHIAKYMTVVRNLTEAVGDNMTAYEIVEVSKIIVTQCQIHEDIELTPDLIFGLIERESGFNPNAVSSANAYGLMQITRSCFAIHLSELGYEFSKEVALNPVVNIQVGIMELIRLRRLYLEEGFEGWSIPLHSYFWGERYTRTLLTTKNRVNVPGLEYSKGIIDLAKGWKEKGV